MEFKELRLVSRKTHRGLEVTIASAKPAPDPEPDFKLSERDRLRLIDAVSRGQVARAELILRYASPGLLMDDEGIPIIVRASCRGDLRMVDLLIDKGVGYEGEMANAYVLYITRRAFYNKMQKD